jgi:putative heme transporter
MALASAQLEEGRVRMMSDKRPEGAPAHSPRRRVSAGQIVAFLIGITIMGGIFAFAVPKFADYGEVFAAMRTLTPLEFWSLFAVMVFNLYTYWLANQAALMGMTIWQSLVETQTSTTIANTLPAGGALAIGMTSAILASWGFTAGEITLFVGVTGIWNIFAKLGLPVVALALLVLTGHSYPALVAAAAVGVVVLVVAILLLVLVFKSEAMARRVGHGIGSLLVRVRRLLGKSTENDLGDKAVKFRRETTILARRRWFMLTWTTLLSQLALCFVLVLSLRHMGVSEQELPFVEIFAVYSFSRLLSAIPITPGGVGVIDLGYIAGLTAFYGTEKAQIVAAVLIFRVLTFGIQIPLGAVTYVIWRRTKRWLRDKPPPGSIAAELGSVDAGTQPATAGS